jgi:drug/metabolite transporter (DMT)-like permease
VLAFAAGLGFGGFFILIAQVPGAGVFAPLLVARLAALAAALMLLAARRVPLPGLGSNPVALLAGVLDAGGNIFYVLAQRLTRLDVAAVLASLYPAATVLLAWIVLKERVSPAQWSGAALCLAAVVLIAL